MPDARLRRKDGERLFGDRAYLVGGERFHGAGIRFRRPVEGQFEKEKRVVAGGDVRDANLFGRRNDIEFGARLTHPFDEPPRVLRRKVGVEFARKDFDVEDRRDRIAVELIVPAETASVVQFQTGIELIRFRQDRGGVLLPSFIDRVDPAGIDPADHVVVHFFERLLSVGESGHFRAVVAQFVFALSFGRDDRLFHHGGSRHFFDAFARRGRFGNGFARIDQHDLGVGGFGIFGRIGFRLFGLFGGFVDDVGQRVLRRGDRDPFGLFGGGFGGCGFSRGVGGGSISGGGFAARSRALGRFGGVQGELFFRKNGFGGGFVGTGRSDSEKPDVFILEESQSRNRQTENSQSDKSEPSPFADTSVHINRLLSA